MTEKKPIYKRWWFWVIAVILVFGIIGANLEDEDDGVSNNSESAAAQPDASNNNDNNDNNNNEDEENEPEEPTEEKAEFGINEPIEFDKRVIEVTNVEFSEGEQFDKPKEGKEYVIVTVSIINNSDKEVSYNPFHFKMKNSNGQIESQTFTIVDSDTALSSGNLAPGGNVSGTIAFEQPIDDPDLTLIFEPSFWSNKKVEVKVN